MSIIFTQHEVYQGFLLFQERGGVLPFGEQIQFPETVTNPEGSHLNPIDLEANEENWNNYQWNPPSSVIRGRPAQPAPAPDSSNPFDSTSLPPAYTFQPTQNPPPATTVQPDPDASPKPTWQELMALINEILGGRTISSLKRILVSKRDETAAASVRLSKAVHTTIKGTLAGRIPNLIAKVENHKSSPGAIWIPSILRTDDNETIQLETHLEGDEYLKAIIGQEDRAHNLYNMIRARVDKLETVYVSDTATDTEKQEAINELIALDEKKEEEIFDKFDNLTQINFTPPAIQQIRERAIETLESKAAEARMIAIGGSTIHSLQQPPTAEQIPFTNRISEILIRAKLEAEQYNEGDLLAALVYVRSNNMLETGRIAAERPLDFAEPNNQLSNISISFNEIHGQSEITASLDWDLAGSEIASVYAVRWEQGGAYTLEPLEITSPTGKLIQSDPNAVWSVSARVVGIGISGVGEAIAFRFPE